MDITPPQSRTHLQNVDGTREHTHERKKTGFTWERLFGSLHPYDEIQWERRDARITKSDGTVVFEQLDIEMPSFWSQTATDIVASKYFRGQLGTPEREGSARQMIDRVAKAIGFWGAKGNYFASPDDAERYTEDLTWLLVNQYASFNSPVWFNVGVYDRPQCSACFILSVDDTMKSILDWYRDEGIIFKGGSGAGLNVSKLRSSREPLSRGGFSSGPVSFMKGADGVANTIRSGGTTRRAAKMVVMNVDHPDLRDFINCKKVIEQYSRALEASGIANSLDGDLFSPYTLLPYQNANNSVRVTDEFMQAVESDGMWEFKAVTTGKTLETVRAREVMQWIADAAHDSADPGMQYDTTINRWNTTANTGRINASNPCFTGDTLVYTDKGLVQFKELFERFNNGEKIRVYTHDKTNDKKPTDTVSLTTPVRVMTTGINPVYELVFSNGLEIKATENHRFWTKVKGWVKVKDLTDRDEVELLDREILFDGSDFSIKADFGKIYKSGWGGRHTKEFEKLDLPVVWTSPFAEYVGYMVGDGSLAEAKDAQHRLSMASVIFGTQEDADELSPRFESLIEQMGIQPQIIAMPNGTIQMRANRTPFVRFLKEVGVSDQRAHLKHIPSSMFQAPKHIVAGFLRGLFSADGCVYNGGTSRYVGLGSVSRELLQGAQQLLLSFGISSRMYATRKPRTAFSYTSKAGAEKTYDSKQLYDLRISGPSIAGFKEKIGFLLSSKQEKLQELLRNHGFYKPNDTVVLRERKYIGKELTYNLTEPRNHSYLTNGVIVANCSEYMHLDNSACNLASLNLLKFLRPDGSFDTHLFRRAVDTMIMAQEIIVGYSSYPTEKITQNAHDFRELGLGYANLGALLMAMGLPYDGEKGLLMAGQITSLMCGQAYRMSALIADVKGPYAGYSANRDPQLSVIDMHRAEADALFERATVAGVGDRSLQAASRVAWHEALELAREYGVRNSQVTVLAPTGTIAFMMDCATTGIEPELALIKYKKLVGGGVLKLVNSQVPAALANLGYNPEQVKEIGDYLIEHETIEGAPHLTQEHLPVFDCSFKPTNGSRSIGYMGHLRMMAAAQPFISGAISKTINMPNAATVEDVYDAFMQGWKMGLKAIAIYRDGSKGVQPLSTQKEGNREQEIGNRAESEPSTLPPTPSTLVEKINGYTRIHLPDERPALTHKFSVGGYEGYMTVGLYPDTKKPGEVFLVAAKEGSTVSGLLDTIATLVSMCLQSGIPLKTLVRKFKDMSFAPAGFTNTADIPVAKSIIDYVFRYLGTRFLKDSEREELFGPGSGPHGDSQVELVSVAQPRAMPTGRQALTATNADAPVCQCGTLMFKAGSCYSCPNCFFTTGVCN